MSILDDNSGLNMSSGGLRVSGEMKRNWTATSKWALFFAVIGFLYIVFTLFNLGSSDATMQMMSMYLGDSPFTSAVMYIMPYMNILTIVVVAVMFFINFYHFRFATLIQKALHFNDQSAFVKSWMSLRNHFMIYGIAMCVLIAFYIVLFIAAISLVTATVNPVE